MNNLQINVAKDFTRLPGVRTAAEGDNSGEAFLRSHLYPKFVEAVKNRVQLVVNLDGTAGYATSFLEAAFGGLIRGDELYQIPPTELSQVHKTLVIVSSDRYLQEEIEEYMLEASEITLA
jgi:hypothetical protein